MSPDMTGSMVRRRNKFGAIRTEIDGIKFASKKEGARYLVLKEQEAAGEIANLRLQVPYKLVVDGHLIARYYADFVYEQGGREVVEDVKGKLTDVYKLKKKLVKVLYNIDILET